MQGGPWPGETTMLAKVWTCAVVGLEGELVQMVNWDTLGAIGQSVHSLTSCRGQIFNKYHPPA